MNIIEKFFITAKSCSEKIALECDGTGISYGALAERIQILSKNINLSCSTNEYIGIYFSTSIDSVINFLAIITSGKTAILLDPNWSDKQMEFIIQNYKINTLISNESLENKNFWINQNFNKFENNNDSIFFYTKPQKEVLNLPENIIFIGFTSGTTSAPKGFMLSMKAWNLSFEYSTSVFDLSKEMTIVAPGALIHGLTLYPVIESLLNGSTAIINSAINIDLLNQIFLQNHNIILVLTPTILLKFCKELKKEIEQIYNNVKKIITAGAKINSEFLENVFYRFPSTILHEYYGASELGFIAHRLIRKTDKEIDAFSIFPTVEIEIRDNEDKPLENNALGVIWVKSKFPCIGYVLKEKEGFRTQGLWATVEDNGFIDNKGNLNLIGRSNNMIISGGKNIYPSELEDLFKKLDYVTDVAIVGIDDNYWGSMVCAVIALQNNCPKYGKEDLKKFFTQTLEAYKFPKKIYYSNNLPYTSSGKLRIGEIKNNITNNLYDEI